MGVQDAVKKVDYLGKFEENLKKLFKLYFLSLKRQGEIAEVCETLEMEMAHYGDVKSIRWVASKNRAAKALQKNQRPSLVHLGHLGSSNKKAKESGKAKKLVAFSEMAKSAHFIHFMHDFTSTLNETSQLFQKNELLIVEVPTIIEKLKTKLRHMETAPGENLAQFKRKFDGDTSVLQFGLKKSAQPVIAGAENDENPNPVVLKLTDGPDSAESDSGDGSASADSVASAHGKTSSASAQYPPGGVTLKGPVPSKNTHQMLKESVEYIDQRFSFLEEPPVSYFKIFDFHSWPLSKEDLHSYGNDEVVLFFEHHEKVLP